MSPNECTYAFDYANARMGPSSRFRSGAAMEDYARQHGINSYKNTMVDRFDIPGWAET